MSSQFHLVCIPYDDMVVIVPLCLVQCISATEAGLQPTRPVIHISAGRSSVVLGIRYMPHHEMQHGRDGNTEQRVTALLLHVFTSNHMRTRSERMRHPFCGVAAPWFPSRARSRREVLLAGRMDFVCVHSTLCIPTSTGMWCR